jgi:hypothetical protein
MEWLIEFLMPWHRLHRIDRELDREERIGIAKMKQELWKSQKRDALHQFHQPMFFKRFLAEPSRIGDDGEAKR